MCSTHKQHLHYYTSDEFYDKVKVHLFDSQPNKYALVSLDFDNFNFINDLFSYEIGNMVLYKMEEHFSKGLTDGEFFSRIHADHFVFWVKVEKDKCLFKRFINLTDVKHTLTNILPSHYNLVCSGGIILVDDIFESLPSLLDKANFARKQVKGNHISNFLYYDEQLSEELEWKKKLTLTMEEALENQEFEMYLQPKFSIKTNQLVGAEALVRWNSKKYGLIYPDKFIPVFEQNGFIKNLDFFMLEEACIFIKELINKGLNPLPISVNFSKVHIRTKNFVEKIFSKVNTYNVAAELIEIEFTESVMSNDFEALVKVLNELKALGFKVSLDDFGRAYSSLNYLKDLPIDIVKIDKEFLNSTSNTNKGRIIISKVVEMLRDLNLVSVMEGIETEEQQNFLNSLSCDLGQGYLYAKPMAKLDYIKFLNKSLSINSNNVAYNGLNVDYNEDVSTSVKADSKEKSELKDDLEQKIAELTSLIEYERELYKNLKLSEEKYRLIIDQIDDVIFEWDFTTDSITFSYKLERIFGQEHIENNFKTSHLMKNRIHPEDLHIFKNWMKSIYGHTTTSQIEFRCKSPDDRYIWLRSKGTTIFNSLGEPIKAICVFTDITSQKIKIANLLRKAELDPLTGLYNKEETKHHIRDYISSDGYNKFSAFFIIDIDNFKGVNDTLGHQFGDTVLQEISSEIKKIFSSTDIIGRIGGDELVVFMKDVPTIENIKFKAELLNTNLRKTYFGQNTKYTISSSIGVAYYPIHGKTFRDLYNMADMALYESKFKGKDCYSIYSEHMNSITKNGITPLEYSERFLNTYFSGDPIFNVFEMLYETKDIKTTINMILEQTGKKFGVDRVYIFEHSQDGLHTSNTHEWCAPGVTSEIDTLQNLSLKEFMPFFSEYNTEGILCCSDIKDLDPISFHILHRQGIKSFLQCAICSDGKMVGFIGFDDCSKRRAWHGDEIATLAYISRILSVFMVKNNTSLELLQSYNNHIEMLDNLNGYVYVIDPSTYKLLYLNKPMVDLGAKVGETCHQVAFSSDVPCVNCPVKKINDERPYATEEIFSIRINDWVTSSASRLKWAGYRDAALICCTNTRKK